VPPERVVTFRARTVLTVLAVVLAVVALLEVILLARQVLTWIFVALFLALALNPLVEWIQRHGVARRGLATGIAFLVALGVIAALGGTFVPILVGEVRDFADALPGYVEDLTRGRGRLGFLEREYQIVERVREAVAEAGAGRLLGFSGAAVAVTKGVITAVVAVITIAVLTFFMLLEGPAGLERALALLPEESAERWRRIGLEIYRTVGGFVTGALTIAVVAGVTTAIFLTFLGVPYAIALGLVVALLDLIPLAGATIAGVLITTVGFLNSVAIGIAVLVFFVVYQQIENHFLYPLVYSRTVRLSPLVILIAVLIGASLAGILGALAAIPAAGTIQVLLREWLASRRRPIVARADEPPPGEIPAPG
jgi:predicted PurR-regulated permease PerM